MHFLDKDGVTTLWKRLKSYVSGNYLPVASGTETQDYVVDANTLTLNVAGGEVSLNDDGAAYGADLQWQTDYPMLHLSSPNGNLYASGQTLQMSSGTETLLSVTQATDGSASEVAVMAGSIVIGDSDGDGMTVSSDGVGINTASSSGTTVGNSGGELNLYGSTVKINGEEFEALSDSEIKEACDAA